MDKKIEKLSEELEQVVTIVEQWRARGMSVIERDIVLERLRAIYQEVKFGLDNQCALGEDRISTCVEEHAPKSECSVIMNPAVADNAKESNPPKMDHADNYSSTLIEPALNDGDLLVEEQKQEPLITTEAEEEAIPIAAEVDEPVRKKLDRETLLSLYHSGDYSPDVAAKSVKERDAITAPSPEVAVPKDIFDDVEHSDRRTVSDVEPLPTVGDLYARNHTEDMGEKISKESTTALRKSIGINDRFQIVKELFEGDQDIYDGVIDELESFTDLDDALLHIHENYRWNPNSEGVKRLIELLTKKLS